MKRKNYNFLHLILLLLVVQSCQKDVNYFVPDPGQSPDTNWYASINDTMPVVVLKNNLLLPISEDSITIGNDYLPYSFSSGLQCYISANGLLAGGQQVTGKINVQTILLKNKGDMIRMDKPTTYNGEVLVSGGSFYINLKKDGNPVTLSFGSVLVKYADVNTSPQMRLFNGDESVPGQFNWLPAFGDSNRVAVDSNGYAILTAKFNWLNCDHVYDTSAPRTTVSASLPVNFTNANSTAYMVFNDVRSVAGMYGTTATKKFSSVKIPVGKNVTIIIISKQGDDYYLGHEGFVTANPPAGQNSQSVTVMPVKATLDVIEQYLDAL